MFRMNLNSSRVIYPFLFRSYIEKATKFAKIEASNNSKICRNILTFKFLFSAVYNIWLGFAQWTKMGEHFCKLAKVYAALSFRLRNATKMSKIIFAT